MFRNAMLFLGNKLLAPILLMIFCTFSTHAQILSKIFKIDTSSRGYYEVLDSITNNRFFVSEKLTSPSFQSKADRSWVKYLSNGNTNLGVGQTYEWFNLNIGINFSALNNDDDMKGRTRFLDLHTQIIGRPYIVNLFGQFYKGVFLVPDSGKNAPGIPYEQRPDIRTRLVGGTVYFVPNWRRFSFAAAITQRDWQKKSAGSPLYGLEFFWGNIQGDSALIPKNHQGSFKRSGFDNVRFVEVAAGIGYGYTLVIKKHWFVHGSGTSGFSLGYLGERTSGISDQKNFYLKPNLLVRAAVGYNSHKFNGAFYLFGNQNISGNDQMKTRIITHNVRAIFAYRIAPGPKLKSRYNKILSLNPSWKNLPPKE